MSATGHNSHSVRFGEFIRSRRLKLELSARAIAEEAGMQASNLCNLEHGLLNPPQDAVKLKRLAGALKLEIGVPEFIQFLDLAARTTTSVPLDIAELITADDAIPLMLRSLGNRKLSKADVARIVSLVRKSDK